MHRSWYRGKKRVPAMLALVPVMLALCAACTVGGAWGQGLSWWRLDSRSAPSVLRPGREAVIIAVASNLGDETVLTNGAAPLRITDRLPAGLRVPDGAAPYRAVLHAHRSPAETALECSVGEPQRKEVTCSSTSSTVAAAPYRVVEVEIPIEVAEGASSGEQNTVLVSGGETLHGATTPDPAQLEWPIQVGGSETPFGVERFEMTPETQAGAADVQAGSHPFQLTTVLDLNQVFVHDHAGPSPGAPALPRNLQFELPPGFLGDPQAVTKCSGVEFSTLGVEDSNACPAGSVIGAASVSLNIPNSLGHYTETVPVFNLVPAEGEPARFGLEAAQDPVILDIALRSDGDYGVSVNVQNITELAQILSTQLTLWGQPDSPAHDSSRGWACLDEEEIDGETCTPPDERSQTPFLTLPTSCTGPLSAALSGDSWPVTQAGALVSDSLEDVYELKRSLAEPLAALDGCGQVPFEPSLSLYPVDQREQPQSTSEQAEEQTGHVLASAVSQASTPAGMNVRVALPIEAPAAGDGEPGSLLGESAVRSTTVVLPEGVQLNPSAANGLQACSEQQVGYIGPAPEPDPLSPQAEQPLRFTLAPASCPAASKIGTVRILSPDLEHELEGGVYLAEQERNPFGSLFALYLVVEDPALGIRVKLAGEVRLDERTGQITSTFAGTPQAPFQELRLHFFEGRRASLATPPWCGTYAATSTFTSWSGTTVTPQAQPGFQIQSGPGGGPCPTRPLPFTPTLSAGSASNQAGAFTAFTVQIGLPDGDQALTGITLHLPAGIAALLAGLTPCREPPSGQEWQCTAASLIGSSIAGAGLGSEPYELPGQAYLTAGYDGAPFGILVKTPAVAGPFNLGVVNVRSRIDVAPNTAAVTITTDPGPHGDALPTRLKGVPAQIKYIAVDVNRPAFEFNPTNCNAMRIEGTLTGDENAGANLFVPYRATGCQDLPFRPSFTASTQAKTSKADGASLTVTVKSGGVGSGGVAQANIAKVRLQLPQQLPARLTTLQKACTETAFNRNPATCPEGSDIATATIHTPVLKSPLTGPAYLVSHGNAAFPDVEFVLQGEGITLILDGKTQIKNGVTYSKFESAPDAPFTTFQTVLPEGPHSALTTNLPAKAKYSLCGTSLTMPTEITAQNGAMIHQTTKIAVQGCTPSKTTKPTRKQKLSKAIATCRKRHEHDHARRVGCERKARRRYAAHKMSGKSSRARHDR